MPVESLGLDFKNARQYGLRHHVSLVAGPDFQPDRVDVTFDGSRRYADLAGLLARRG